MARLVVIAASGVALIVFSRTAYPTITWWDSSGYSLAAATMGITSSPGSLLLTLLGWPVARLPLGIAPAHALNLLAGALAAITTGLVGVVALRILRSAGATRIGAAAGAAVGSLGFAFSATLWDHAIKFTPYVLTALFTALILLVMMRWWEDADRSDAWRWLLVLGFLIGLDFSVHRTNALLVPGLVAWILVRQPRTAIRPQAWIASVAGLVAGLAVHLLHMPISASTHSPLNMFEPSTWSRFWDYVTLAQRGGGFLVELWPRKSAVWSNQIADFLHILRDNFLNVSPPARLLGVLPALGALLGIVMLWRRHRRLALAFTLVILLHAVTTIFYFNIPAGFFRPFDRHYLPVFVSIAVMMSVGLGVAMEAVASAARTRGLVAAIPGSALIALVPITQLFGNWTSHDASRRYFTRDYAVNALEALPPNAIYFTAGDNDTFPVMYMQAAEGVRRDVRIVNMSLANTGWYVNQIANRDPSFPVSHSRSGMRFGTPMDTTPAVVPIRNTAEGLGLPAGSPVPDSVTVRPAAFLGGQTLPADIVLLDIVRTNAWRDPITFAVTAAPNGPGWLTPYARLDGLFWRLVPVKDVRADRDVLRGNLLERYQYRGYNDSSVIVDDVSRVMGRQYFAALEELLKAESAQGALERCQDVLTRMFAALPPERVQLPATERQTIEGRCRRAN